MLADELSQKCIFFLQAQPNQALKLTVVSRVR
jgi:hypothetical protein